MDNLDIELDAEISKRKTDKKFKPNSKYTKGRTISKGNINTRKRFNDHHLKK